VSCQITFGSGRQTPQLFSSGSAVAQVWNDALAWAIIAYSAASASDPEPGLHWLSTSTCHLRLLAISSVCALNAAVEIQDSQPFLGLSANSVNSFISGIRERSSVSTSASRSRSDYPAVAQVHLNTAVGSSFPDAKCRRVEAPIAFAAS